MEYLTSRQYVGTRIAELVSSAGEVLPDVARLAVDLGVGALHHRRLKVVSTSVTYFFPKISQHGTV
jgi:hypothetical protein